MNRSGSPNEENQALVANATKGSFPSRRIKTEDLLQIKITGQEIC